jgi:DUF1680 family protein
MKFNRILCAVAISAAAVAANAQIPVQMESFSVNDVTLTESAFKHAEDMDIRYLLGIDPDRLLAPYLKEAGLEPKADNYTNWENTGLDGHIGGHYLSALSYMYASTGNLEIKGRLDYVISELYRCAEANGDGYISGVPGGRQTWKEISEGDIRAASFSLNDKWVPLYNIHKIFAGLRDAYLLYGSQECKEMFIGLTDWMYRLTEDLSDEQLQGMLASEHGGLNEVFADAAAISGDERFMNLAKRFSHKRVLEPLLKGEDHLTGMHANTQIPKVIGYKRIADLEGYADWDKAAQYFWETVVDNRSITIGGNSVREHFHPADDFSSMLESEQGPETCNTYNMLRLTKMLYETTGDTHYMDYYERAVYNHILSTMNPIQGGFVYFTPMRAGHYRVYSQPQTSFWCCVGSGMENHARYGEMVYSHKGDSELFVNLFIPSELDWKQQNLRVRLESDFPHSEWVKLTLTAEQPTCATIRLRYPAWSGKPELRINGRRTAVRQEAGSYIALERTWHSGDRIEVRYPMSLRIAATPDDPNRAAICYGPIVLAERCGMEGMEHPAPYSDPTKHNDYYTYDYRVPTTLNDTLSVDRKHPEATIQREGEQLRFRTADGRQLEPLYEIHRERYIVYWNLKNNDLQ